MFGGIKRGIISIKANDPHLSNFISEEKDKIASIKSVASFTTSSSQYFSLWSEGEHEDLKDIAEKYSIMSEEFSLMLMEWEYAQVEFREKLKAIRTMSDEISALKYKIKTQTDKYDKDKRSGKQVEESLFQIRALENSLKNETCNFERQKRALLQQGLVGQFNGILKFAQKATVYATKGNHLAFEIPQINIEPGNSLPFYNGKEKTSKIQQEFQKELYSIRFNPMVIPEPSFSDITATQGLLSLNLGFNSTTSIASSAPSVTQNNSWAAFSRSSEQSESAPVDLSDAIDSRNSYTQPVNNVPPIKPERRTTAKEYNSPQEMQTPLTQTVQTDGESTGKSNSLEQEYIAKPAFNTGPILPAEFDNPW